MTTNYLQSIYFTQTAAGSTFFSAVKSSQTFIRGYMEPTDLKAPTHHFSGGFCVLCSHMLLQGDLCVAHPAAVGTGEGLRLFHRERLSAIVQVWNKDKLLSALVCTQAFQRKKKQSVILVKLLNDIFRLSFHRPVVNDDALHSLEMFLLQPSWIK